MKKSQIFVLLITATVVLMILGNVLFLLLPKGNYRSIVVHHTASGGATLKSIRELHRSRGWFEAAYHFVMSDGSIAETVLGNLEPTWRYQLGLWSTATRSYRHNRDSVHLCVVGNYEREPMPEPMQLAVGNALVALQRRFDIPDSKIYLHRQCSPSICPGQHITQPQLVSWAAQSSQAISADLKADHKAALGKALLTPRVYILAWLVMNGVGIGGIWRLRSQQLSRPS